MGQAPEPMKFNFSADGGLEALRELEGILCSSNWNRGLDVRDEYIILLIQLIRSGGVVVIERRYPLRYDYSDEERRKADRFTHLCRKRAQNPFLLHFASRFPTHEPDMSVKEYNALFFPDLGFFIRCGDLDAQKMFEMFEHEDGKAVIVAPDSCISNTEGAAYMFVRVIPWPDLTEQLASLREKRLRHMSDMLEEANEKSGIYRFLDKQNEDQSAE
jgi:hypothetical protein